MQVILLTAADNMSTSSDNSGEYFTMKIWFQDNNSEGHVSLEMHDGTYVSVFRSRNGVKQCASHNGDLARLGRDSDVTIKLFTRDHFMHPERVQNWLLSYRSGEIIYDPSDTSFSVVYAVLLRCGCPAMETFSVQLTAESMKNYVYGMIRFPRRQKSVSLSDE